MIRLIQRRLIVPRGDTGTFSIPVLAGKDNGDASVFTIFDPLTHRKVFEKVMELSDGALTMDLTHGDTVNLPVGQYVWDIKFYTDAVFDGDGRVASGTEVDSYYAAFQLPICEIRETGDNLLLADDAPDARLAPDQINYLDLVRGQVQEYAEGAANSAAEADTSATNAENSASAAAASLQAVQDIETSVLAAEQTASAAAVSAQSSADLASQKAAQIEADLASKADKSEIPTKISDLTDDSGHYTKPANGIPASDLEETYLTSFTETDPTVPNWAKQAQKPTYTAQEVGALPADTVIPTVPTNVSAFTNDAGYLTTHQDISGKANSADLATVATSGDYDDLINKPTIPEVPVQDVQVEGTSILENGIANLPYARNSIAGLFYSTNESGFSFNTVNGIPVVAIKAATPIQIKEGTQSKRAITPSVQHTATFYGLAKAAGSDMKDIVNTTVGTYPDAQKAAIQNMLGITDLLSTEESSTATAAHTANSLFMMDGKLHRATAAIAIGDAVVVGQNCEVTNVSEAFPHDIQINNRSIVNNGIATIPIASGYDRGVMRLVEQFGIRMGNDDIAVINNADDTDVKVGTSQFKPIVPRFQDRSIFYGLSKLAGVDLASETVTVGTYPETSKTAIRSLIGAGTPLDVQIDSTSIISNGVANIPKATTSSLGVVKVGSGLEISDGAIRPLRASDEEIKAGTNAWKIIVPSTEERATFYGLAKAAGDTSQVSSSNAVGTYTETAKSAIRGMLGAVSSNVVAVQDEMPTAADNKVWLPETEPTGIEVPTYAEFQALDASTVKDVQINNTSIINNGIANIPICSSNTFGVVKVDANSFGIKINNEGKLYTDTPSLAEIKAGTQAYKPIVSANVHYAAFYGLAKAAGDTTQSQSENAVGTYTNSAKIAIKNMLGITQTLTITVLTQDNVTVTGQTVTIRAVDATGPIFAIAAYEGQPVTFAVPSGFAYYVSVSDTLAHHFNPTTASGVITDTDASVTLTYSDFSSIQTAADIKAALNAGLDLTDLVGEQISCTWNNSTLVWDVVDYSNNTITLLTHDTLPTQLVFEPVQALMWCENGLAAGSYSFIDGSSTYYFTLTTAIPSGGQLRATTSAFQTYASMEATATLETGTVSTTEISGATSLGTTASGNLNHMSRVNYGSNNYKESALFQWLNSTEAANIPVPRITKFSRPCTYSVPGFLGALDSSFVAAIDDTTWLCSTNNTYECPTSLGGTVAKSNAYTVTAKIGLASEMEIFGSYGGTADGSAVFDLFNGATADDRKKYQPGTSTARFWWLRSPGWSGARTERYVNSSGAAYGHYAYNSLGVVPAVKISKTVVSE